MKNDFDPGVGGPHNGYRDNVDVSLVYLTDL